MLLTEKMKRKEDFTVLERQISDYILEHRDEMFEMTLAELAGKLYMSKATVIRYFKKLGFSSYRELCVELAREQNYYQASVDSSQGILADGSESIMEMAAKIQKSSAAAMSVTAQYLDYKAIQDMAELISKSGRILICGYAAGGMNTADNMFVRLSRIGKDVTVMDHNTMYLNTYRVYDRNTAVIMAVYNDSDGKAAKTARTFYDKGMPVLLLTGPFTNEIDRYAYRIARTHFNEESDASTASKRVALEFLGDVLYYAVVSAAAAADRR